MIEPTDAKMLAAIGDGRDEAMAPKQGDGVMHELGGALHEAPPLRRARWRSVPT
jgi:hypothetical protein